MLHFNLILVPIDFSDKSMRALTYAIGFAEQFGAELRLLYVHEPMPRISDMAWQAANETETDTVRVERARKSIDEIIAERVPDSVAAKGEALIGSPTREITKFAKEINADLIIMATHGRTGLSHMLMGSTAEAVVRKAPCPVLTLKQPMLITGEDAMEAES